MSITLLLVYAASNNIVQLICIGTDANNREKKHRTYPVAEDVDDLFSTGLVNTGYVGRV